MKKFVNIISLMVIRELKMFFYSKSKVIGTLVFPVILTLVLKIALGGTNFIGLNMDDIVITGILVTAIAIFSLFSGISIIWDRKTGFMKELLISPVNKNYILFGKIVGISILSLLIGITIIITNPIKISFEVFVFMFLTSFVFAPLGIYLGFRSKDFEDFGTIVYIILTPLILFAGVLSPISSIPKPWQYLSYIDPLTYPLDGIRHYVLGQSLFGPLIDFLVCIVLSIVLLYLAKRKFEKSEDA